MTKADVKQTIFDVGTAIVAGLIVGLAYFFFQNSNGFAPGGVGGLATITYHYLGRIGIDFPWAVLMIAFNQHKGNILDVNALLSSHKLPTLKTSGTLE